MSITVVYKMKLTKNELEFMYWVLLIRRVYRGQDLPHGVNLWPPWKEAFWIKVNDEINNNYPKLAASLKERHQA